MLRKETEIDLSPYLVTLKEELNKNLSMELSEGVNMTGKVNEISIQLIQPRADELHIQIHSLGKLGIKLD